MQILISHSIPSGYESGDKLELFPVPEKPHPRY